MYVSRQSNYYDDGAYSVEIAARLDVSGPGALVARYAGEGEEYSDPREAVEAAIRIADEWSNDMAETGVVITLAMNDMVYATTADGYDVEDYDALRKWAQDRYDAMPKCDRCGSTENVVKWTAYETGSEVMACGQFCADEMFATEYRRRAKEILTTGEGWKKSYPAIIASDDES